MIHSSRIINTLLTFAGLYLLSNTVSAEYRIINYTCYDVTVSANNTDVYTEKSFDICANEIKAQEPKIILYEKPPNRCTTDVNCEAGSYCNTKTGTCEVPPKSDDISVLGIVLIVLVLIVIVKFR